MSAQLCISEVSIFMLYFSVSYGVSLTKPNTSVTALHMHVCSYACLVCLD